MKEPLLVSACLVGKPTKYNGKDNQICEWEQLKEKYRLILVCPEVAGGLEIPRLPSERTNDRVVNREGKNVTKEFQKGAETACFLIRKYRIKKALLKEGSPSCGVEECYDGTFSGKKIFRSGVTTERLKNLGIEVYSEKTIKKLLE